MSEKDTKMLSSDSIGEKILNILNRVGLSSKSSESDCKSSLDKAASSPDSAIDMTEDSKHCHLSDLHPTLDVGAVVHDILDNLLDDVLDTSRRRDRKKKRQKYTDFEKWNLIKQESTIGWKRILSRDCEGEGGWGFNYITPSGLKITIKELERFLKKKKIDIDDLVFEAHKIELHSYPRKKVRLSIANEPVDKIKDLKLPKKLELERRKKLAAMRAASQPTFKSISEFLASLDEQAVDCQYYGGVEEGGVDETDTEQDCSDVSRLSGDQSFNISVESVSEEYGHCSQLLEEIIHNVVAMSGGRHPATSLISPNTRIKSLEKNMAEVQLTLSSMLQNTPKTKLNKLRMGEGRGGSRGGTPDRVLSGGQSASEPCDRIEKLKITPDRLRDKRPSSDYVSEMNTPTSLKIRKPSGSPERSASNKSKSSLVKLKSLKSPGAGRKDLKKKAVGKPQRFSIFKTRNSTDTREENAVNFTDKTVGKSLSIRRSSRDNESKGAMTALSIDIDDDDVTDEITKAAQAPGSPHGKVTVVGQPESSTPVRRNIFGAHSPALKDEVSPEKVRRKSESQVRPAMRTQSRVLSNEDAIKAIDAVVTLSDMRPADNSGSGSKKAMVVVRPPSVQSTPTPTIPLLSPQESLETDSHSNMTTPSLPSLSPAIRHVATSHVSPSLPTLSPALQHTDINTPIIKDLDPSKSAPLSVEIPPNHINNFSPAPPKMAHTKESTPRPFKSKKSNDSPIERSSTGRRMRDCRKFIHYEFSPPFVSSDSSFSELDSPDNRRDHKLSKKRLPLRTQSMTEECLSSPNSVSSNQSAGTKKRGRPLKSKSTDCKEEVITLDDDSNASSEVFEEKKRKRGRPPKKRLLQDESCEGQSVSELAESLTAGQMSPITRQKVVFPLSSPNTEERKARLISQQRESFMLRRHSDDNKKAKKQAKKIARSKSTEVSQGLDSSNIQNLELMKTESNVSPNDTKSEEQQVGA